MIEKLFAEFNIEKNKLKYFSILVFEKLIILSFHFYFVKLISSDYYGLYNQTNFISSIFQNILMFGVAIPFLINVSSAKNPFNKFFFNFYGVLSIIVCLLIFIVFILFSNYFSYLFYGETTYYSYIIILMIVTLSDIFSEYLILHNRIRNKLISHSIYIITRTIIRVFSLLFIYYITESFFIAFLIASICYLSYSVYVSRESVKISLTNCLKLYREFHMEIKTLFNEGMRFIILYIIITTSSLLINLLVVNQFNIETLAIYSFNFMLASIPITILQYITFYSLPDFSKRYSESGQIRESNFFKDIIFTLFLFVIFFIAVYFLYDFIMIIVNDYYSYKLLFVIIFLGNILYMFNNFFQFPLLAKKRYTMLIFIMSFSLLLNLIYLYFNMDSFTLLTPVYGFLIANVSTFILLIVYQLFNAKKDL